MAPLWLTLWCLLVSLYTIRGQKASMTVAFAYLETALDLGWTWRHNQGRVYMHTRLLEKYPTLSLQSIYEENVPQDPDCSPIFEEWAQHGVDLIVGTSYGYQACMAPLAPKYPKTTWLAIAGTIQLNVSNWGIAYARIYEPTYLAGIIAGHATKTGHIGCVMPLPIPENYRLLAAFALGVSHVNASFTVHAGWTNSWNSPRHEVLATGALVELGSDVLFYTVDGVEGLKEASQQGRSIIGCNSDQRMQLGELVLVSPYFVWGVIYFEVAEMVLLGTFAAAAPINLDPGLREGAVALSDLSFLVPKAARQDMEAAQQAILNGSDPFCGPIRTNAGTVVVAPGQCLCEEQRATMTWEPDNVVDHGEWLLPSEVCGPGDYALWDHATWNWTCQPCPTGMRSVVTDGGNNETMTCVPCEAGQATQAGSPSCDLCLPGTAPSWDKGSCDPCAANAFSSDGVACLPCPGTLQSLPGAAWCSERPPITTSVVIMAAAVGSGAAAGLLVVAWVLLSRYTTALRLLQRAPSGHMAVMFTDVQRSAALSAQYPESMAHALLKHQRVIRATLEEFGGYEVKAVDDSFMVVFQDPNQALQCAMRIQEDLLEQQWPSELMEEEACRTVRDNRGQVVWGGLRVRIGLHFGAPDWVVDRRRCRVDFFGSAVHAAAQVESRALGGQTLITEDLYKQIPSDALGEYHFACMGPQFFQGVPWAVEVYSVLPESLGARTFVTLKENICLHCEYPTVCPKCDAVLQQLAHSQPSGSPTRPALASLRW
eukprot:EG_transcript_3102